MPNKHGLQVTYAVLKQRPHIVHQQRNMEAEPRCLEDKKPRKGQFITNLYKLCLIFSSFLVAGSFWIFSRFTVDDAFISWRYGKNLFENGVWA